MLSISIDTHTPDRTMDQSRLDDLHTWFNAYVATFDDIDEEGYRNIRLKVDHTRMVCDIMALLASGEQLAAGDRLLAEATALLHDVGRFPQFRRWRTFRDSDSDNHARLGIDVLREQGVLADLPAGERTVVEEAIRFHNQLSLPAKFISSTDLFIRLIRDADKLDIWRVFYDYFRLPEDQRPSAVTLGFPDLPVVTPSCIDELAAGRIIDLRSVRTLNDFKLLQVSWVYDLNFSTSYQLVQERGHIRALTATIPPDPATAAAVARAEDTIARKARKENS